MFYLFETFVSVSLDINKVLKNIKWFFRSKIVSQYFDNLESLNVIVVPKTPEKQYF